MKEYEYRVTAENDGGESEPSDGSVPIKAKPLKGKEPSDGSVPIKAKPLKGTLFGSY